MGLFDNFVKNVVKNTIGEEEANKLGDKIKEFANENKEAFNSATSNVSGGKEIPSDYSHFPAFDKPVDKLSTKNESKYKRCTMDIYSAKEEDIDAYREKIESLGYKKMTNVRYEKDNEYIIVESTGSGLHLVFHIRY